MLAKKLLCLQTIISQITDRLDSLSLKICLKWVKSHQDKSILYSALPMPGWMNVDANSLLANHFCLQMADGLFPPSNRASTIR
jgi:hypothetical protein